MPPSVPAEAAGVDEDLHSRQLAVYGRETMARMARSGILVSAPPCSKHGVVEGAGRGGGEGAAG